MLNSTKNSPDTKASNIVYLLIRNNKLLLTPCFPHGDLEYECWCHVFRVQEEE